MTEMNGLEIDIIWNKYFFFSWPSQNLSLMWNEGGKKLKSMTVIIVYLTLKTMLCKGND